MENSSPAPTPLSQQEVEAQYTARSAALQAKLTHLTARRGRWLMGAGFCIVVILLLVSQSRHGGPAWPLLLAFAALATFLVLHMRLGTQSTRVERLLDHHESNLARVRGEKVQSGLTGESLRAPGHLYEHDLNLLGPDSLFGLLATVRTGIGQRGLAEYLLHPVPHETSAERQAAVREMTGRVDLREQIAVLGASKFEQVEARFFDQWLDQQTPVFAPAYRWLLALTSAALTVLLLLGLLHVAEWQTLWPNLALAAAIQAGICLSLRQRVRPILESTARLSNHVRMFQEGLALLERQSFQSARLNTVQAAARVPADAVPQLKKLESQVMLVQQRTKEIFFVFSLLFAAGTQVSISLAAWKRANGAAMRGWLAAWAEFEALSALANYALEHPEHAWPELLPASARPVFEGRELGHPLLAEAVANDISLGTDDRFLLISGSNMSGKSTLMRSIGINAVLAYAGAPVQARSLRLTTLRIGASLALTDSLAEGKSKFLAEVERLQKIVTASEAAPVLFLVDEIFSGTNSADRRAAGAAVLGSLLEHGAIGALSTHDLALTDLATEATGGRNVHMASPDPEDPLGFDYKLKPGVNTSSNAMAIIRMIGLVQKPPSP